MPWVIDILLECFYTNKGDIISNLDNLEICFFNVLVSSKKIAIHITRHIYIYIYIYIYKIERGNLLLQLIINM